MKWTSFNNMLRLFLLISALALSVLLSACGADQNLVRQVEIEKRYFGAQKILEKIYINPNIADENDFKLAIAQFHEVVQGASTLPPSEVLDSVIKGSLARIGQLELARDNVDAAVAAYQEIVKRFPQDDEITVSARLTIGLLHERTLQYNDAIAAYSLVLPSLSSRIAPQDPEMYLLSIPFHFARLHKYNPHEAERVEAYRRAQECYQTIIAKFPNSKAGMTAVSYLAALMADQEQWQKLDGLLHQQIAKHANTPELPHFIYTRAMTLHERLGETARARALLEELLKQYPNHDVAPQARFEIARMILAQNQNEAGRQILKEVIKNSANNPGLAARAQEEIAMSYEREGQWVQALNEYRWLAKQYETLPPALNALLRVAYHYTNANNQQLAQHAYDDAIAYYQGLINKYPRSVLAALAQEHIANCFIAQKRWDEAAAAASGIENILDSAVGKVSSYMLLGNIYESSGQNERAIKIYNEFIQRYPQHPLAHMLKQKVLELTNS